MTTAPIPAPPVPAEDKATARFPWGLCLLLTAMALGFRVFGCTKEALFFDEYITLTHCSPPSLGAFFRDVWATESTPSLYFLVVRWGVQLLGDSVGVLRMSSVLFGGATVWAMLRVVHETRGAHYLTYVTAGGFCALSGYDIYYSQEARPYAMQVFFIACHLIFAVRLMVSDHPHPRGWDLAGFLGSAFLALATHLFSVFLLGFSCCLLVWRQLSFMRTSVAGGRQSWREAFPARIWTALGILIALGLIALLLTSLSGPVQRVSWLPAYSPDFVYHQWRAMVEGPFLPTAPKELIWLAGAAWALLMLFATRHVPAGTPRMVWGLAWLAFFFTAAVPHGVGLFRRILLAGQRYEIICLPAFWLLTALPFSWLRRRFWVAMALLVLFVPSALYLSRYYRYRHKRPWDTAAEVCRTHLSPGDAVWLWSDLGNSPLWYYLRDDPFETAFHPRGKEMPSPAEGLRRVAVVSPDPWLVRLPSPPGLRRALPQWIVLETQQPGNQLVIMVYERKP